MGRLHSILQRRSNNSPVDNHEAEICGCLFFLDSVILLYFSRKQKLTFSETKRLEQCRAIL